MAKFSVKKPLTVFVVVLAIVVLGVVAYLRMTPDLLPNMDFPYVVIVTTDPKFKTMVEELFGPVITVFVYDDAKYEETLDLCDASSPYALTGSIFARDRAAITTAMERLRYAAGNFYINDKPTGAVVSQQPFGGSRASGTNDKAGSALNLIRWTNVRAIKETLVPPTDFRYPFLGEK